MAPNNSNKQQQQQTITTTTTTHTQTHTTFLDPSSSRKVQGSQDFRGFQEFQGLRSYAPPAGFPLSSQPRRIFHCNEKFEETDVSIAQKPQIFDPFLLI